MKLAVSNIAWPAVCNAEAFAVLSANGITGLEVAPSVIWPDWKNITAPALHSFRRTAEEAGLQIVALQSILFQKPGLHLFGDPAVRHALLEHLKFCADLAAGLGAKCVVFGAPKNRARGDISESCAFDIAAGVFSEAAQEFASRGTCLAFEPNPEAYSCDFATTSESAAALVGAVNSPGFRLHLDTACLYLAGETAAQAVYKNAEILAHFHVSEPHLHSFASPQLEHAAIAEALENYPHWVSLEMRSTTTPMDSLRQAAAFLRNTYGH